MYFYINGEGFSVANILPCNNADPCRTAVQNNKPVMKKLTLAIILIFCAVLTKAQTLAGEYKCHFKLNQAGSFSYKESGEKYFTILINEKKEVKVKMNIEIREEKTRATNYVDITGSAEGELTEGTNTFEANGILMFSIYEKEVMDTRWEITTVISGNVVIENGAPKMSGTIQMTRDEETTTASFTGDGKNLKIPYTISCRLGYDYAIEEKVAFPLAIKVDYLDDNYIIKKADLVKVFVPNTDMMYDYNKQGSTNQYSYQTTDPNDRGAVFGPSYNINLVEDDNLLELEFSSINANYLQMLPANALLCYVTKVDVFSKKDNKLQQVTDTFKIKVRNHFKVYPLANGKFEKAMVGGVLLEAGSGARFFPLGSSFKIPVGARMIVQFIDGTVAVMEFPVDKTYPDMNVEISLGISAAEGINGEGDVVQFKLGQLSEKGTEKAETKLEKVAVKFLLSTAQKGNVLAQLIDFFAASKTGGEKPVAMVRLRSVVGIVLGTNGTFVLKNYEGHPDVITESVSNAVPAGQEFNLASGKLQAITADADFDALRKALTVSPDSRIKGLFSKLTGEYWYFTAAGGLLLIILLVLIIRSGSRSGRSQEK